jgi:hypothetical protein
VAATIMLVTPIGGSDNTHIQSSRLTNFCLLPDYVESQKRKEGERKAKGKKTKRKKYFIINNNNNNNKQTKEKKRKKTR